jgi:hypothetical protein
MDKQFRTISSHFAGGSLSRRGLVGSLGRVSAAVGALGLGLTGLPRPVAAAAAAAPQVKATYGGVIVVPISFDRQHLHDGQETTPPGAAKAAVPHYPTSQNGCACPGDGSNPCYKDGCCVSATSFQSGPFWSDCTQQPCCCNPCSDTCCSLGRAMTYEYNNVLYTCCDGSKHTAAVPTGNFGCDTYGTCSKGVCC